MASPTIAANAYASLARMTDPAGGIGGGLGAAGGLGKALEGGGASFGDMLKNVVGSVVDAGRKSDNQSQALAAGKANVVDVVTAVAETEVAVSALVSVRDRVIQSYEEIMRMPI